MATCLGIRTGLDSNRQIFGISLSKPWKNYAQTSWAKSFGPEGSLCAKTLDQLSCINFSCLGHCPP